jgi:hypothetical protein
MLLREVLDEVLSAKSLLSREGLGVRQDLVDALSEFGVHLPQLLSLDTPEAFNQVTSKYPNLKFSHLSGKLGSEDEVLLVEICLEAGERVKQISRRLMMVNGFEESVRDWMRCLAYEAMQRRDDLESGSTPDYVQ